MRRPTTPVYALAASLLGGAIFSTGCARPLPIREEYVLKQVAARYTEFLPEKHAAPATSTAPTAPVLTSGLAPVASPAPSAPPLRAPAESTAPLPSLLLRPRFGLPEIAQVRTSFSIELLSPLSAPPPRAALVSSGLGEDAAARCLQREAVRGCFPIELAKVEQRSEADGLLKTTYRATQRSGAAPPGGYDLLLGEPGATAEARVTQIVRAPKAVWLRVDDPAQLARVKVAHLSDLHIGKGYKSRAERILARVQEVIRNVNARQPDLVVVTGDIVNNGVDGKLLPVAEKALKALNAPVLVVLGNHDHEFSLVRPQLRSYGIGWSNFARTFHPFLHFSVRLGGYDFVGFDSGPAERTPRILTRGLTQESVALLREDLLRAHQAGRGVVLLSHAPSRAVTFSAGASVAPGFFGRFRHGRDAFDSLLVDAAARKQEVVHLAGHTHWSDIFEVKDTSRGPTFTRWPFSMLSPCSQPVSGPVAIITTQAAGHSGILAKENARGYGYSLLTLGGERPEVAVFRYGTGAPTDCPRTMPAHST